MSFLDSLPLVRAKLSPDEAIRLEAILVHHTEVEMGPNAFDLTAWDAYLAQNIDMLAPRTFVDGNENVLKVTDIKLCFMQNNVLRQTLSVRDENGYDAGQVILEGSLDG